MHWMRGASQRRKHCLTYRRGLRESAGIVPAGHDETAPGNRREYFEYS